MAHEQSNNGDDKPKATPRSAARLAAVQALYQMDVAQTDLTLIIEEFSEHRLGKEIDGEPLQQADANFFKSLLKGVVDKQKAIDPAINEKLAEGWRLSRIDSILRAILRSAAFEMMFRPDVPTKVVINEYIDIAHAFFEGDEPKVVNAVLDQMAKTARTENGAKR